MLNTQVREVIEARRAAGPDTARTEPSHIHIPRPSRVRQASVSQREDGDAVPVQLTVAVEEAA